MRILLLNVPHLAIGSRIPKEHLPPLGLLSIGGSLIDGGHDVRLIDAEFGPMPEAEIIRQTLESAPDIVMVGHSGSTSAHPIVVSICQNIRRVMPEVRIVYGGVFPTFHAEDVLRDVSSIDVVVRGEGEMTALRLADAFESGQPLREIPGISFREGDRPVRTADAPVIEDLDSLRVGWELVDLKKYSYWGGRRAVVIQFSRGCPHGCTYCGQRGFWKRFRHRDPRKFAAEVAWLSRHHGVELINLADENPTSNQKAWLEFLEAMIEQDVPVTIVGSTRADDIVRDAEILHLYKKAGVIRFLLGTESTDEKTLKKVRKGATTAVDREAIRLLRQHGILSLVTFAIGFEEERDADMYRVLQQLLLYDPDQIQSIFATPHRWTPFSRKSGRRKVIQTDQRLWDYKHQVLKNRHMPPWRTFCWVKGIEAILQLRPQTLARLFTHPDGEVRHGMRWYTNIGRRVWIHEVLSFFFREFRTAYGPDVETFWGGVEVQHLKGQVLSKLNRAA